ncbi:uncharacterized protein LOC119027815 isoform X1 [Acanthopagrus latus]|uniref:uncharacterized protein LOC119027815 isoform X1 n=1 Tax=Acanthopagrus latus TaxID=8177 RepID=UPI00187CB174|nr:uncharacterized protein LOC119027815 isoform X1 [Acanthopagrus latus]
MKLLLSSLLLASLCALSSWSASSVKFLVTQSSDVSVREGETVNIACCLTGEFQRATVTWLKNQTSMGHGILMKKPESSLQKNTSDCSNKTFINITREDSERYTCKVNIEIPFHLEVKGNGTVITVTSRVNATDDTVEEGPPNSSLTLYIIICLAVVTPSLLLALACFYNLRKKRATAARVIYEVPHIDSEEADMDKHSTSSSRGSSQWCQVAVYESFDYFERVQTKESG